MYSSLNYFYKTLSEILVYLSYSGHGEGKAWVKEELPSQQCCDSGMNTRGHTEQGAGENSEEARVRKQIKQLAHTRGLNKTWTERSPSFPL